MWISMLAPHVEYIERFFPRTLPSSEASARPPSRAHLPRDAGVSGARLRRRPPYPPPVSAQGSPGREGLGPAGGGALGPRPEEAGGARIQVRNAPRFARRLLVHAAGRHPQRARRSRAEGHRGAAAGDTARSTTVRRVATPRRGLRGGRPDGSGCRRVPPPPPARTRRQHGARPAWKRAGAAWKAGPGREGAAWGG